MGHRTLVHVSCLLVAVGFQWSAHNQPGKKEKTVKILREVFLPGKGWNLEGGVEGKWDGEGGGEEEGPHADTETQTFVFLGEGCWAFNIKSRGLLPTPGPCQDVEIWR